ncbi:hypothetical protein Dsin_006451 [Dipteronia sinensis]|uniref:DUF7811 domain-containing protein n=1 Tax=Dipteronia sinensis TaxID=43782 RepID=A0AAE0AZT6_9ROSI|nr:hypothetical protein Dsin_006451 [Dipteronia sinensis]
MPETSALCFSPFSPLPSISRPNSFLFKSSLSQSPSRLLRFTAKASNSSNFLGDDSFNFFPWTHGDTGIEWVQEDRVTLFTADGMVQIGSSMVPKLVSSSNVCHFCLSFFFKLYVFIVTEFNLSFIQIIQYIIFFPLKLKCWYMGDELFRFAIEIKLAYPFSSFHLDKKKHGKSKTAQRFTRFQESDYMDPNQGLCLGALFDIAATNGLDMGRRLCIFGFCRSIEMLSDVVEDTVLEHGGEVVVAEKASKGGLHEKLTMTVAVPYLWGVPPASETLHLAVQSGGGIVEKIYWQWDFL